MNMIIKVDRTFYEQPIKKKRIRDRRKSKKIIHMCKVCNREIVCTNKVCPHWVRARFVCIGCRSI